jgi:hypothetical protein
MSTDATPTFSPEELAEENKRTRRLQLLVGLVMNVIGQGELPYAEALRMIASTRRIALQLFPGKETAFDLIYQPRLKRLLYEVYRIQ